jgi:signal transduction histidine kinase
MRIEGFNRELEQKVRERTAALRKAYEDLKQLDHLKDDFLSSMSHELLTPLTSIQSFSEILLDMEQSGEKGDDRESGEFLTIINKEAIRLTGRLKDLLDLSQIETGKVRFDLEPVVLRDVLQQLFSTMGEDFRARRIQAVVLCPPTLSPVRCDRKWISRAISSLLSNAIKFSDEGAEVKIEFGQDETEQLLSVVDTGCGIAPEYQTMVFERFRQIGDLLTEKPTGIGLGLPLARQIVEAHRGRIWVESEPGQGAKFTIALPISQDTEAPVEPAGSATA